MMKKGAMYQAGGPVKDSGPTRSPGKRRIMEGGPKGLPMMTPEQRRMARESMTPEERREADAPLTAEEVRRMGSAFKKGGKVMAKAPVKKKAGGMIGKPKAKGK